MEMSRQKLQTFLMKDQSAHHLVEESDVQQTKHEAQYPDAAALPSSSPSHEFSFSISFHGAKSTQPPVDRIPNVDLSPADDLFFQGHLLPLRLLRRPDGNQNLPVVVKDIKKHDETRLEGDGNRSKPLSLFGTWRSKLCNGKDQMNDDDDRTKKEEANKKKSKLDVVKKYMRLIKVKTGFLSSRRRGINDSDQKDRLWSSYSGNLRVTGNENPTKRWELSAPASMRTSPANSGVFMDSGTITPTTMAKKSDSTMEELQAAIQAAIAHCKNSNKDEEDDDDNYIKLLP